MQFAATTDLYTYQGQHSDRAADDGGQDQSHRLGGHQRGHRGTGVVIDSSDKRS